MAAADTKVCPAGQNDAAAWDHFVLKHPYGLGYQLFAWGQAVNKAYGFEPVYLMARTGGKITGVLPMICMGLPMGDKRLVSLPYCDAGGILADSPDSATALLATARHHSGMWGGRLRDYRSVRPLPGINEELTRHPEKVRMLLELPETEDALAASLKSKVRSQAGKPEKEGLSFELGGLNLVHEFYRIFRENMRDLGSPVHSEGFFYEMIKGYGGRAQVGLVRLPDGQPAAAGIILCHPTTVSIPWASSLRRYNPMNPNMMLYRHFLKFVVEKGARFFDFGRSTPGEGTFRFKRQWGARPSDLHWAAFDRTGRLITEDTDPGQGRMRYRAEQLISRMPLSLATWAGSLLRRYISL